MEDMDASPNVTAAIKRMNLRVDIDDEPTSAGDDPNVALIKLVQLMPPGKQQVLMSEVIRSTTETASTIAHRRADEIRRALGLLNCYSVSDGSAKLYDVYAMNFNDALRKLAQEQDFKQHKHLFQLRIDLVR